MIEDYFTESIAINRITETKVNGVNRETKTLIDTVLSGVSKMTTKYAYYVDKDNFDKSLLVVMPYGTDVVEADIITYSDVDYTVISVIDPANRHHHLEIICEAV